MSDTCLYQSLLPSDTNDIIIFAVKLDTEKIQLGGYFIQPEQRNYKRKTLKQ